MNERPTPETDADVAEAKRRAKWLHKYKAPKNWIILTVFEVSTIREEIMTLARKLDEARKKIWRLEKQIEGLNNAANERFDEIERVRKERDEAREAAAKWEAVALREARINGARLCGEDEK